MVLQNGLISLLLSTRAQRSIPRIFSLGLQECLALLLLAKDCSEQVDGHWRTTILWIPKNALFSLFAKIVRNSGHASVKCMP